MGHPAEYFGPFATRVAAEKFANDSLDFFKMRRCTDDLQPDPAFPGCIYSEMKMCLAPCFKGCTDEEYAAEVARVQEYFSSGGHSLVREILLGPEKPKFTGRVAHRTVFPASLMGDFVVDSCTKWWGPDRHIVVYPVNARRDEIYFVTSVPDPDWDVESWSTRGEMGEVRQALAGFHEDVQRLLAACPGVHKWALFERDPLPRWTEGPIVLLGDACHPMTPYMAQGAANALEDAAVLSRCLAQVDDPAAAFQSYQATRLERTARIQLTSRQNTWGRQDTDPSWVYGYDALQTPLARPGMQGTG